MAQPPRKADPRVAIESYSMFHVSGMLSSVVVFGVSELLILRRVKGLKGVGIPSVSRSIGQRSCSRRPL